MSYAYAQKKRGTAPQGHSAPTGGGLERSIPNSARLAMLGSGAVAPTAAEKGHRVDMPEALRERMESSFGADFSAVKLYESRTLENSGAAAMARGNEIAFAPGKLDFASQSGQALLGHELSHVASQTRGEVRGSGFLADAALEARADREGAMAARGEQIYGGAVAPLSSASAAPMAGPMQASADKDRKKANKRQMDAVLANSALKKGDEGYEAAQESRNAFLKGAAGSDENDEYSQRAVMNQELERLRTKARKKAKKGGLQGEDKTRYDALNKLWTDTKRAENPTDYTPFANADNMSVYRTGTDQDPISGWDYVTSSTSGEAFDNAVDPRRKELMGELTSKYKTADYKQGAFSNHIQNPDRDVHINGLDLNRIMGEIPGSLGEGMSPEQITEMSDNLMAPHKTAQEPTKEGEPDANERFDKGMYAMKDMYYQQLKRLEATYGTLGTQLHPEDFMQRGGKEFLEQSHIVQDTEQLLLDGGRYFDFENNEKDKEFKNLHDYYMRLSMMMTAYGNKKYGYEGAYDKRTNTQLQEPDNSVNFDELTDFEEYVTEKREKELGISGPRMSEKELAAYKQDLKKRAKSGGWTNRLFGRYRDDQPDRREQVEKDVDRMAKIQAGITANHPDNPVSDEDRAWLKTMHNTAGLTHLKEMSKRKQDAALRMRSRRKRLDADRPNEDANQLDREAVQSGGADFELYSQMMGDMTAAPNQKGTLEQYNNDVLTNARMRELFGDADAMLKRVREDQASKDADELFRLQTWIQSNPDREGNKELDREFANIAKKGASIELFRELSKRRNEAGQRMYQNMGGAMNAEPLKEDPERDFKAGLSDEAMDMETYTNIMTSVSMNGGKKGEDAYEKYMEEDSAAAENRSEQENANLNRILEIQMAGTQKMKDDNPLKERLESYRQQREKETLERAKRIYGKK